MKTKEILTGKFTFSNKMIKSASEIAVNLVPGL